MKTSSKFQKSIPQRENIDGLPDQQFESGSEFSHESVETGLKPEENILDLAIDCAEFFGENLSQIMDTEELTPQSFQTFVTVDFYDHDSKATDIQEGFKPDYSTQFSFKNKIDDFYI